MALGAQVASQVVSLVVLAFLYRLIEPGDFGLLGMVVPLLLFLRIFSTLGLNVTTIQWAELSQNQLSNLFWLNLALGLAATLLTAALAPAVAWFYGRGELTLLTVALAGTSLTAALGAQHGALLERQLRFGAINVARLAAQTGGGAAGVAAAWMGAGVWALVLQQYIELLALAAIVWRVERWRPAAPQRGDALGDLVRFGGNYSGSSMMFYLALNVDKVLVGYALGEQALGLYSQAFNLMMKPVYVLTTPLTGVMLPALSRAMSDPAAYRQLLLAFYRVVAIAMLPVGVGLMLVAPEAIRVLGGERWVAAGPLLRVFAAAILVQGFIHVAGSVFASAGRADRLFAGSVIMLLVLVQGYAVGLWFGRRFGEELGFAPVLGVAAAYSLSMIVVVFLPYHSYCLATVGVPLGAWIAAVYRAALASAGMGLIVWSVRRMLLPYEPMPIVLLAIQMAVGVAVYAWLARGELRWLMGQLRQVRAGDEIVD